MTGSREWAPWSRAWAAASAGFWSGEEPAAHFRTSVSPLVANRVADIVRATDLRLGCPDDFWIVDIGCGDGQLLELVRDRCPDIAPRAHWLGVDVRPMRREGMESIRRACPAVLPGAPFVGLVMAHEWLDEIPCDVIERDESGVDRVVLVDRDGSQMLGPPISDDEACARWGLDATDLRDWTAAWWPLREPGDRAEVGVSRDRAWAWIGSLLGAGCALSTDYGHDRHVRIDAHRHGTLTAYLNGRVVAPVPDGTVGLTAHVALDSCAAALPGTHRTIQRDEITVPAVPMAPDVGDIEVHFHGLRLRTRAHLGEVGWLRWEC